MMDWTRLSADPRTLLDDRSLLWSQLFALAEAERLGGDGRALRILERYRDRLEKPRARALHVDDGA